jgi:hypothetical protein
MEHPLWDFHAELGIPQRKKPGLLTETGLYLHLKGEDQPRVRERIMKLSKVYSATCHHRYWSER